MGDDMLNTWVQASKLETAAKQSPGKYFSDQFDHVLEAILQDASFVDLDTWISAEDIVERITRNATKITKNAAKLNDKKLERKVRYLEMTYKKRLDGLLKKQKEAMGVAFFAWLIPLGLIYAVGYGSGWVYRGFKGG